MCVKFCVLNIVLSIFLVLPLILIFQIYNLTKFFQCPDDDVVTMKYIE